MASDAPVRVVRSADGAAPPRAAFLAAPRPPVYGQDDIDAAYTRGFFAGGEEAKADLARGLHELVQKMDAAQQRTVAELHRLADARREEIVRLAFDVARWLLQEELHADPARVLARVAAALPDRRDDLTLRVAPGLVPVVAPALPNITVVADADLAFGDLMINGPDAQLDGTIDDALERLAVYLHADDDGTVR